MITVRLAVPFMSNLFDMKKLILILPVFLCGAFTFGQNIGIGTTTPTDQLHTTGSVRFEGYSGTGTRLVQIDPTGKLTVNITSPSVTNSNQFPIPDNGCTSGTGISSDINIIGQPASVQSSRITVRINITHTFDQDLRAYLYAPNGNILCLTYNTGGSGHNFTNTIFTDAAVQNIGAGTAPFTGNYQPQGNLVTACLLTPTVSSFAAIGGGTINPNGTWSLKIYDGDAQDVGTLGSWDIGFFGPESFVTGDQNNYIAKFSTGNLVPGQIYEDAFGNIGIGTTVTTAKLTVTGGMHITGNGLLDGSLNTGSDAIINGSAFVSGNALVTGNVSSATSSTTGNAVIGGNIRVAGGSPGPDKVLTSYDVNGNTTWQLPAGKNSGFSAGLFSNTSFPPATTLISYSTLAPFGYDDAGSAFQNGTSKFFALQNGVYHFDAFAFLASVIATGNGTVSLFLYKNNGFAMGNTVPVKAGDDLLRTLNLSWTIKLTAGDFVQVYFFQNVYGGNVTVQSNSSFTGFRVY